MTAIRTLGLALALSFGASAATAGEPAPAERDTQTLFREAARKANRNDLRGSAALFEEIARRDASWSDVFYNLGQIYAKTGDPQRCVLRYTRFLVLEPTSEDAAEVRTAIAACEARLTNPGHLRIDAVQPSGIDVLIDGVAVTSGAGGPVTLAPGRHQISASAEDFEPFAQEVTIESGQTATLSVNLVAIPRFGTVRLTVREAGVKVTIDGTEVGTTPLAEPLRVQTGRHLLALERVGYHNWQRNIEVFKDTELALDIKLLKTSVDPNSL